MTTKYPRDPDSTIRILKTFYKMGDFGAMFYYNDLWDLGAAEKTADQEVEASQLEGLLIEMRAFERTHGRGSCLQLTHPSVIALIAKGHYPDDVISNAQGVEWVPVAYPGWKYPGVFLRNTDTSSDDGERNQETSVPDQQRVESARSSMKALIMNEACSDHVLLPQYRATAPFVRKHGDEETVEMLFAFEDRHPRISAALQVDVG